jgi:hypothetical protein
MAGESKAPGGVRPTRHALSRRHRSELDRKLLDSRVLRQGRRTSTAAFITPGSTKSPGAIVDTGALSRRRAKREGHDGPSQCDYSSASKKRLRRAGNLSVRPMFSAARSHKIAGSDFGRRSAWRRRAKREGPRWARVKSRQKPPQQETRCPQNRRERFWAPEQFRDGARSARARTARVNLPVLQKLTVLGQQSYVLLLVLLR